MFGDDGRLSNEGLSFERPKAGRSPNDGFEGDGPFVLKQVLQSTGFLPFGLNGTEHGSPHSLHRALKLSFFPPKPAFHEGEPPWVLPGRFFLPPKLFLNTFIINNFVLTVGEATPETWKCQGT